MAMAVTETVAATVGHIVSSVDEEVVGSAESPLDA